MLLDAITTNHTHAYAGIIGSSRLYGVLDEAGHADTALAILSQTSYPSFGYAFANALERATTNLWELPDAPFEGTGMNSRNHHMFSSYSAYLVQSVGGVDQQAASAGFTRLDLRASSSYALHAASTKVELPHGTLEFNWTRVGGRQYDKVAEGGVARLDCGKGGGVIQRVAFASFGTPRVGPSSRAGVTDDARAHARVPPLVESPSCHAPSSVDVIRAACVGRPRCEVGAERARFGLSDDDARTCDAAAGDGPNDQWAEPLRLWVAVECGRADGLEVVATVPMGSRATVRLPLRGMAAPVLRDGQRVVYAEDAATFVPVAEEVAEVRVRREVDARVGEVLAVEVGSGVYALALEAGA